MSSTIYERPEMIERGSFAAITRQYKRWWGWDHWRRRRGRDCD